MIDLRSDTVTIPTPAMREAMMRAEVGDDVYGDDPTVLALEARVAEILGKEAAAFMPSGTMTNQVALRSHTEAGDAILADIGAHVFINEGGASAGLAGVLVQPAMGANGVFSADDVHRAVRIKHPFSASTLVAPLKLVCVENTHNLGGGTIWPLETVHGVAEAAKSHGLALHLDGARLWNAAAATGISEGDYAAPFDSISVCFSKGLGAPVGSALAGSAAFIQRARRFKQMFGGGFRQAGMLAAAALHALAHHRDRLKVDHENARELGLGLAATEGVEIDLARAQTNILRFKVTSMDAASFVEGCHARGVYLLPTGPDRVRAVLHGDVRGAVIQEALRIMRDALGDLSMRNRTRA